MTNLDVTETMIDAKAAEDLLKKAVETCEVLRKQLDGSDAAAVTRLRNGLRIALDRVGSVIDHLEPRS